MVPTGNQTQVRLFFSCSSIEPLLPNLLAQLHAIKTSQRSCIDIPRSFDKAYSPGHLSIGDKELLVEFEGALGTIFSRYHHASWFLFSRRKVAKIKSILEKVRFQTLRLSLGILILGSHI